jgi:hypothetical protein
VVVFTLLPKDDKDAKKAELEGGNKEDTSEKAGGASDDLD